jgi:hypothetical protein
MAVTSSWLKAVGIENATSVERLNALMARRHDGVTVELFFQEEGEAVPEGAIVVDVAGVTSMKKPVAFAAFHKITDALGYGIPIPVSRPEFDGRASIDEDPDLIVMRHAEYRLSPDLSTEDLLPYRKIIRGCTINFYRRNTLLCDLMGYDVASLELYAIVWTCNYMHRHKRMHPRDSENEKLLLTHLRQRFAAAAQIFKRVKRSVVPHRELACLVTFNDVFAPVAVPVEGADDVDMEYVARHCQLNLKSESTRRNSARALLRKLLSDMKHEDMVEALMQKVADQNFCPDSRSYAARILRKHQSECADCASMTQMNENLAGAESLRVAE